MQPAVGSPKLFNADLNWSGFKDMGFLDALKFREGKRPVEVCDAKFAAVKQLYHVQFI